VSIEPRIRSAKDDALNEAEANLMLSECRDLLDNLVVRLPLYAGMRIGEIQHMRETWLNWEHGYIEIPARQYCSCYECRQWRSNIWRPKSRAGIRNLPITPELEPYLRQLKDGINRSRAGLEKRFEKIRQRAIPAIPAYPHCLRASFATRLAESGISAPSLTYLLGWQTLDPAEFYIKSSMRRAHEEFQEKVLHA
jgi:integrase